MPYWPLLVLLAAQALITGRSTPALLAAQALGYYVTAAAMLGGSAVAGALFGEVSDRAAGVQHAVIFTVSVGLGQATAYALLVNAAGALDVRALGAVLLTAPAVAFAVTTFRPPRLRLFRDPLTNSYGLPPR